MGNSLMQLTKENVLKAIAKYERDGHPSGYGPAREYWLKHPEEEKDELYPQKAIYGIVFGLDQNACPNATVTRTNFEKAGFTIISSPSKEATERQELEAKSLQDSREIRMRRLENAPAYPPAFVKEILEFRRNPDVVAQRLELANGKCQKCGNCAPFISKSTNAPYLEVHHIQPLSKGGKDAVCNTMALCPNCHREIHFGTKK